ncbi:MAG: 23S rRNA (adenine(2503)-C(2))-methyltransferase RlmN [Anaerolineae bacterium]|nr:23S rRNA (adenine(2503)-C(2))-methyltransferase RlmN [Anaerolineae bacterium]
MIDVFEMQYEELLELLSSWGEPSYRADQIWSWIYRSLVVQANEMHNLPRELRRRLEESLGWQVLWPVDRLLSGDGLTEKVLFHLHDEETIESVLMRYEERRTVCVSTQVGCPVGCSFCATGQSGFKRNLTAGEILAQVLHFARGLAPAGAHITNVVFMGMGEPLMNYDATWEAIRRLNDHRGFNLGARHFTISTAGWVPGIRDMAQEKQAVGLGISLHATNDELRNQLVPLNRRYPLAVLTRACREYTRKTRRRITFEYALMDGVNDTPAHAKELAELTQGLLRHVNLIPLNPTSECEYRPSRKDRIERFRRALEASGVPCTLRISRGVDIQAGCGQLRARSRDRTRVEPNS